LTTLVDSSVWIDFFNGKPSPEALYFKQELRNQPFLVGDLILAEVLQGFRHNKDYEAARAAMLKFQVVPLAGQKSAIQSAQNYRWLRSKGITIRSTIDCLIASYCIAHGHALLHSDRDYSHFEDHLGLIIVRL
jgi:predicted nucleic acid-binding protein